MPILKFMFATLVTALCLDSIMTHVGVYSANPGLVGWMAIVFCTKLVVSAVAVAAALWCRSAWRAWHAVRR